MEVLARRRRDASGEVLAASKRDCEDQGAQARVLAELPRLFSRMSSGLAELNGWLAADGVVLGLATVEHKLNAKAVYTVTVSGACEDAPVLYITVDWTGALRVLLRNGSTRALIGTSRVFDLTRQQFVEFAIRLLEISFH